MELKKDENYFNLLFENVKDYAIILTDQKGYIINWNKGAEKIKGYSSQEKISKHISVFYNKEEVEKGKPEYNLQMAKEKGSINTEGWRIHKDGSLFWANVVITLII